MFIREAGWICVRLSYMVAWVLETLKDQGFNDALLGKQCWRILKNPTSLVSRILKAKYFPNTSFLEAELGKYPSFLWRSVWQARQLLKVGLRWKIGNGLSVKVSGKWIPQPNSAQLSPFNCRLDADLLVADLIDRASFCWKTELLIDNVDVGDLEIIKSIPISLQNRSDELVWHYSQHGIYTVKSWYYLAMQRKRNSLNHGGSSLEILYGNWFGVYKSLPR